MTEPGTSVLAVVWAVHVLPTVSSAVGSQSSGIGKEKAETVAA
jgi:hypothetical protein